MSASKESQRVWDKKEGREGIGGSKEESESTGKAMYEKKETREMMIDVKGTGWMAEKLGRRNM